MDTELMFSSKTDMWSTPQYLFDEYNRIYNFTLDVCASSDNAKCEKYFTKETDGLLQDWSKDICWMNPPYGKEISRWVEKAYTSSQEGAVVVCLLPARTDTRWFHTYCIKGRIEFLKGRLKFGNAINPAPFPSMVVVFNFE